MKLHSMTVIIVMTMRPRDAHIHRRHGNSYVMSVCEDSVYEGLRNDCAYGWVVGMLRTNGLYEFCVHVGCYSFVHGWRIMTVIIAITPGVYDGNNRHGRQLHDGNNRHESCGVATR